MAKGEPNNIFIKVDLDSNKMGDSKGLRLNEVMELNDIEFYKVENDKIYFLANSNRMTLLDGVCNDIIEFYIRDGKPVFDSILSKTKNTKIFHYGLDDIVTYATLNTDNEKYELNFTSSDISFKVKNNGIRDSEIQYAITKVIEADFYGSCCLLVSAFKWLIPVFVVICFFTAFQEKIKEKYRKKAFLILILISIIFKLINNYSVIYSRTWIYIPKPINNPLIGSIVAIFSSIIIYSFAYIEYKKDTEKLFIGAMTPFAMADMIITSTLYVQYII